MRINGLACAMLAILVSGYAPAAPPLRAYVGSYGTGQAKPGFGPLPSTNDFAHGRGISLIEVDPATGAMSRPRLVAETPSPGWLVVDARGETLYAGNEIGAGTVSAFRIDKVTGALTPLGSQPTKGAPVSLAIDPSGKYVLAANYVGGSLAVFPIRPGGGIGPASDVALTITPEVPARSPSPVAHVDDAPAALHMVGFDRAGRFVFGTDAMQDRIFVWRLDGASGKLVHNDPPFFEVDRGLFPRHFVFSPGDRHFYTLNERGGTIDMFDMSVSGGNVKLVRQQSVPTLPADFHGRNATSELLITDDGRFVYAANRGHDTIAAFAARPDGRLTPLGEVPTQNDHPRSMAFDPAQHFIFSLNQRGDQIAALRIDPKTGRLSYSGQSLLIDSPGAMAFAK